MKTKSRSLDENIKNMEPDQKVEAKLRDRFFTILN